MEESNNKELIEVIKERLKTADEIPYRTGAWEDYKAKYQPKKTARLLPVYWAAAAALVVGSFTFLLFNKDEASHVVVQQESSSKTKEVSTKNADSLTPSGEQKQMLGEAAFPPSAITPSGIYKEDVESILQNDARSSANLLALDASSLTLAMRPWAGERSTINFELNLLPKFSHFKDDDGQQARYESNLSDAFVLAQQENTQQSTREKTSLDLKPKRFSFNNKFELGAFVSPSTTNQTFDVGGGLVLAYQLSDKLALRTGASFNQYEVGILGADLGSVNGGDTRFDSPSSTGGGASLVSNDVPYRTSNLLLPDLNSVSGKVQTLDIPLEVKYNVGRQFYATGGVSYAVVLSQERFNHITEYSGVPTYSSASDSGEPTNQPMAVERTLQAEANNVNTNGFGGFVNFSIGRKTKLSKSFKLSIEPFVKIPIGQFKSADMDYTNGGLRVITTF
ncbi:outer membrane beta-barrel protein [Sphingobacterium deserti]|uniref:Outer membrane protein beta-barrel domain-containing protein n=1 Tax=Sphingobacterium deserti TaxID=1229276 RepID=A0A0B8T6J2_9SPHI|nr:outer membrane beta-barrel protein [Sphingobacterium deserti]KGE12885.1 hypothetical protein DI53_3322 [Sphingobacterium deserti]